LIQEIREQYKDNPQKMQKAIMELYREKKVNPFGGCLPLILQMPIFIALFQAFMRFIEFKEAKFLWIKDLSEPDRLFLLPNNLPVIGNEFNILPIIMIVLMLLQQRLSGSSQAQDPATAQQQKIMSIAMSVVFGLIFYHMPSGLVLYWTVNSLLMFVFQAKVLFAKSAV
jgi:YidC/Oxa1 family membrane protein insertase